MKRLPLAAFTLLLVQSHVAPQTNPRGLRVVSGTVVQAGTSQPLANVTVELTGIAGRVTEASSTASSSTISVNVVETAGDGSVFSLRGKTDRSGQFQIRNVPPGSGYHLIAVLPDYLPAQYGQRVAALPGVPLNVTRGEDLTNLRVEMTPAATISGRVVTASGNGVRTFVEARRPWYYDGLRVVTELLADARKNNISARVETDRSGRYRLEGLSPGQYYIYALPARGGNSVAAFAPGAGDSEAAVPVDVRAGATIANVDIKLGAWARRLVTGKVVPSATGAVIRSMEVFISSASLRSELLSTFPAFYRETDRFELRVVQSGDYELKVRAIDAQGLLWSGRASVTVQDRDVKDLTIPLIPYFDLKGRIVADARPPAGSALDPAALRLDLHPASAGTLKLPVARIGTDGTFEIRGVPLGDYRVDLAPLLLVPAAPVRSPTLLKAFVKSVRLGDVDVLNDGLRLRSNPPAGANLDVVISFDGGMIDGRVVNDKRQVVPDAKAVLVPEASFRGRRDLYKVVITDNAGRFQLQGIPPGAYKLFVWESVEDGAWQDPRFLRLYENLGQAVVVEANGYESLDTTLIPAWN